MSEIRLQKFIADQGICSRRKAEVLIVDGNVKVNDVVVTELGTKINPETDTVVVNAEQLEKPSLKESDKHIYIALNKPVDYITSTTSEQGQSVMDLLVKDAYVGKFKKELRVRVYPVGRLDKDSEGLVLLTNDGELANKLTHPRYEHEKEYDVVISGRFPRQMQKVLEKGMVIDGQPVKGIEVKKIFNKGKRTVITVILTEGKNRQIRKMFGQLGLNIITLRRTRIGKLQLGVIPVGQWKFVSKERIV